MKKQLPHLGTPYDQIIFHYCSQADLKQDFKSKKKDPPQLMLNAVVHLD